jgi:hypothetical protein
MSEVVGQTPDPEQAVFGNIFSIEAGIGQEDMVNAFFEERKAAIVSGAKTWLPRTLDADSGVCVDLYKAGKVVATLNFDYEDYSATVYTTSEGGNFGDTTLCDQVSFAEAVASADQFAG